MKKIAILGCENSHADLFLQFINENYKFRDLEVVGVYSAEREAAEKLNKKYGVKVMNEYDELVGKVDGIINTARHGDSHYKFCKPYINDGIPMFVDKPITISEKDALDFMKEAKANKVKITGGSCIKHEVAVQKLKNDVINNVDGKTHGGLVRATISCNNPHGGFFFYVQHLVETTMEIFGRYPKSVVTFKNGGKEFKEGDDLTIIFKYEDYNVVALGGELVPNYYVSRCSDNKVTGYDMEIEYENPCFFKEFDEFYNLVKGDEQIISYKDFIAPVFVINAIKRSLDSGKEEVVNTFEI